MNDKSTTLACLKSIVSNPPGMTFEVIVVDQRTTGQTSRAVQRIPDLVVAGSPRPNGFAESSVGRAMARGECLVFLHNAAAVTEGWLAELAATFDDLPRTGLVVPKVLHRDGRLKEAGHAIKGEADGRGHAMTDDPRHPRYNFVRELHSCSAACMMIPRDLFSRIGGFAGEHDGEDDAGAALALKVPGHKVVYQPAAGIVDRGPPARGRTIPRAIPGSRAITQSHFHAQLRRANRPTAGKAELARLRR